MPPIIECPPDQSEAQWAHLIFTRNCTVRISFFSMRLLLIPLSTKDVGQVTDSKGRLVLAAPWLQGLPQRQVCYPYIFGGTARTDIWAQVLCTGARLPTVTRTLKSLRLS